MISDDYNKIFADKQRVLVVFSHPDDLEVFAGGTVARLVADDKEVRSVKVTSGDMGSQGNSITPEELSKLRETEDREAMKIFGIKEENNIYLRFKDGTVENGLILIEALAKQIREFRPDIIITHNPEDILIRFGSGDNWVNHRDHRNTGASVTDAAYPYSRDTNFFPEQIKAGLSSHKVTEILFVDYYSHPDMVYIDVTDSIETRIKAHAKHSSQYSEDEARDSADFFTIRESYPAGKRFESFRYFKAD